MGKITASKGSKGDYGFADAWWKGKFAWEYKRKDKYKSLDEAYSQLLKYREALENPPLLVVSDIARIQIHTNFTGTAKQVHEITLDQLNDPGCLDKLRRVFTNPDSFKPTQTTEAVTAAVAAQIGYVAQKLRERGHDPHAAAKDAKLKKRTLTNLYNERPTWLRMAHEKLDRAVLAAYAATDPQGDWSEDWAEVWTETGAGQPLPGNHPLAAKRAEVDQKVLANLLRLNYARSRGQDKA